MQDKGHSLVSFIVSGDNMSDLLTKAVGTKKIDTLYSGLTGHNMELLLRYADKAAELILKLQSNVLSSVSSAFE